MLTVGLFFTLMGRDGRWVGLPEEVDDRMEGALLTAPLRPGTSRNFEDGSMVKDRRDGTRWKHKSKGQRATKQVKLVLGQGNTVQHSQKHEQLQDPTLTKRKTLGFRNLFVFNTRKAQKDPKRPIFFQGKFHFSKHCCQKKEDLTKLHRFALSGTFVPQIQNGLV